MHKLTAVVCRAKPLQTQDSEENVNSPADSDASPVSAEPPVKKKPETQKPNVKNSYTSPVAYCVETFLLHLSPFKRLVALTILSTGYAVSNIKEVAIVKEVAIIKEGTKDSISSKD